VAIVVVDDHLLRDVLAGQRTADLDGLAPDGIATTGLWLFRLCSSYADPRVSGKLSAPVAVLSAELQESFRTQITALPTDITVLSMRELAWPMAQLQSRHRGDGRSLSAAMVEALAAAHAMDGALAVSRHDIGPNLHAAAKADDIPFYIL
jgi:hypothetical protein